MQKRLQIKAKNESIWSYWHHLDDERILFVSNNRTRCGWEIFRQSDILNQRHQIISIVSLSM